MSLRVQLESIPPPQPPVCKRIPGPTFGNVRSHSRRVCGDVTIPQRHRHQSHLVWYSWWRWKWNLQKCPSLLKPVFYVETLTWLGDPHPKSLSGPYPCDHAHKDHQAQSIQLIQDVCYCTSNGQVQIWSLIKPFFLFLTAFPALLPTTVQLLGSGTPTKVILPQFIHFLKAGKTAGARLLQTFVIVVKQAFDKLSPLRVSQPFNQTLGNNRNLQMCSGHASALLFSYLFFFLRFNENIHLLCCRETWKEIGRNACSNFAACFAT